MDAINNLTTTSITNAAGTGGTTISVTTGTGANFPATPFNAAVWAAIPTANANSLPMVEIVRVTSISGDNLTVTRQWSASAGGYFYFENNNSLNITSSGFYIAQVIDSYVIRSLQNYSYQVNSTTGNPVTLLTPVGTTAAWLCQSDTAAIFTTNSSGNTISVAPNKTGLLVGSTSDTAISVNIIGRLPSNPATNGVTNSTNWATLATNNAASSTKFIALSSASSTNSAYFNGSTWGNYTTTTTAARYGVAYGVSGSTGYFVTCDNGANTTQVFNTNSAGWAAGATLPSSSSWQGMAYGSIGGTPTWVVANADVGGNPAYYNSGTAPTTGTFSASTGINTATAAIAFGNGKFMAIQSGGTGVWTSSTGTQWSNSGLASLPIATSGTGVSIAYGNGRWVIAPGNTSGMPLLVSLNDGVSWMVATVPNAAALNATSVTFGCGQFVAASTISPYLISSYDGINWSWCYYSAAFSTTPQSIAVGGSQMMAALSTAGTNLVNYNLTANYPANFSVTPVSYNITS